jgi:O-antigen/teichoic acid export membrane protein
MSGKAVAAFLALVTTPIIARIYFPEHYGTAAVFMSIITISSNVASLRYEAAVALPKDDDEATALLALSYRILFGVALVMLMFIGLYELSGAQSQALEVMGSWIWALPVGVLFLNATSIQESWLTRVKSFKRSSTALVIEKATTSGSRITLGIVFGPSVSGLLAGTFLGIVSRLATLRFTSLQGVRAALQKYQIGAMRNLSHKYSDFPKYNALASLVFALGQNLPVLLFGAMYSPAIAGFYAMANRLFQAPTSIVAASVRRVFLQRAADIHNQGKSLRRTYLLAIAGLGLLGAPLFFVLWYFGETMLGWLLGERWLIAGRYLEIMAPWLFSVWVASPCNSVFVVLREQKFFLYRQLAVTALRFSAFGIAYLDSAEPEWALAAYVSVTVVANVYSILSAYLLISRTTIRHRQ